jgi:hypothetical protein
MPNSSQNSQAVTNTPALPGIDLSTLSFGQKFEIISDILGACPGREKLRLLKAVSGECGHRVMAGLGTAVTAVPGVPSVNSRPKAPVPIPAKKSPEEISAQKRIKELNSLIKTASQTEGRKLPFDHPLLVERQQLFLVKHGKALSSEPEETSGSY